MVNLSDHKNLWLHQANFNVRLEASISVNIITLVVRDYDEALQMLTTLNVKYLRNGLETFVERTLPPRKFRKIANGRNYHQLLHHTESIVLQRAFNVEIRRPSRAARLDICLNILSKMVSLSF